MYYRIEDIKSIPIQDVCSMYGILLKQKGQNWWGRLRANDKTPSFSINPSKNIWRDWGISKGGDVISLVSEIEGVDQGKAIAILGEKFGIEKQYTNEYIDRNYNRLPTFKQYQNIGIYSNRAIVNLDINLEKQSLDEVEKLEEKYKISIQELAKEDSAMYHAIIDSKALPNLYENRKLLIENYHKYITCNTYVDMKIYENMINEYSYKLNNGVDIYNKARLDGINLDDLKISMDNLKDLGIDKKIIKDLKKDVNYLKEKLSKEVNKNNYSNTSKIEELNYVIKVKENVLEKYKSLDKGVEEMQSGKKFESSTEDKIKKLSEQLEEGIKNLFESDKYKNYLKIMSKFHNYSFRNSILIMMQNPEATYVAGFNKWNTLNRKVNKGEKGLKIFAPAPIKKKVEQYKKDENGNYIYENGKKLKEEIEQIIPKYKITHVFDISQTSGEQLPNLTEELKGNVNDYENFNKALENSTSFNISYGNIKGEAKGYCTPTLKRIMIKENMSEVQTIKTLLHEMAHAELHTTKYGKSRETKEVEAESIAFIVSNYYGVDTSDYSFGYLAGWSSDKELVELKESLNTIQKTAADLIEKIDSNYKELFKDKEIKIEDEKLINFIGKDKVIINEITKDELESLINKNKSNVFLQKDKELSIRNEVVAVECNGKYRDPYIGTKYKLDKLIYIDDNKNLYKIKNDNRDIKEIISDASKKAEEYNNRIEFKEKKGLNHEI